MTAFLPLIAQASEVFTPDDPTKLPRFVWQISLVLLALLLLLWTGRKVLSKFLVKRTRKNTESSFSKGK